MSSLVLIKLFYLGVELGVEVGLGGTGSQDSVRSSIYKSIVTRRGAESGGWSERDRIPG